MSLVTNSQSDEKIITEVRKGLIDSWSCSILSLPKPSIDRIAMLLLSKIDANLLQFSEETVSKNVINLHLNGENKLGQQLKPTDLLYSHYSNTIELSNNEYISYHLSVDHSVVTVYTLGNTISGKTINIYLPSPSINKQHTLNVQEEDENLSISIILQDGTFLLMKLPLDFILSEAGNIGQDWFQVLNPYDFTIRVPHSLHSVTKDFSVVFLDDGGLLGLKRAKDNNLEPILFNDNSYLQSLAHMFSRKSRSQSERVISCVVFLERYLVVLTQNCHLKLWDLRSLSLVLDNDLSKDNHFENFNSSNHENPGNFLSLLNNWLTIYLPFGNGIFLIGELKLDSKGKPVFNKRNVIHANLSSSSIWSLIDMSLLKPLELALDSSYLNLVVLWKSGLISKVQILNLIDNDLQAHEWIETSNRSLSDIEAEQDLNVNGDVERGLLNLRSRYTPQIFEHAQKILSENNILTLAGESETEDYVANLETVLRDLKNKADEASSLTIYRDEIIVVNCLQKYNHSVCKINSTLENIYYNIYDEAIDDELTRYLKTLHCFSTTLPRDVLLNVSEKLVDIVSGNISKTLSPNEKFTEIFKICLASKFEVSNLKLLFDELNTFDVIPLLNDLIENHLRAYTAHHADFVDSITVDNFTTVMTMESIYQTLTIQRHFVLQVLLTFAFLDFDYERFSKQLESLLDLHFKQSLMLGLYQIDRSLLTTELFDHTTKFRSGVQLHSYPDWLSYLNYALSRVWENPVTINPYSMKFFERYVIQYGSMDNQRGFNTKLLLRNIGWPFYIRNNQIQEFMLAMMLFVCEKNDEAYEFFHLHDYSESISGSLPECLKELGDGVSNSVWSPLISSATVPYRHSKFEFELSLLFIHAHSTEFAYKCIKKSIDYSMKNVDINEPQEFKENQLKLYLDLLFLYDMFSEALDVLRLTHDILSEEIRKSYFKAVLDSPNQSKPFFATLMNLCHEHKDSGSFLSASDYQIIDEILSSQLRERSWRSYKILYSFRIMNTHDRSAAELIYEYLSSVANDTEAKRKCYLIIINVLSTFDNERDRWLLSGSNIISLPELKTEFADM